MLLNFVGPIFRLLERGVGRLAGSSEENPKTSAGIAGVLALFGMAPETLHSVGKALATLGAWLQTF